ncbi:MAG: HD domain-containing protein, partial [Oscillospiraceae bacterium]|nr:HD domain-containing protein [Oscillospiraceae bacterium]
IKYHTPAIRDAYRQVEAEATEKLLGMLPEELRPAYAPLLREEDGDVKRIVKAADKLSAYIKCLEELEAGNNEFGDAAAETLQSLRSMEMEEIAWFLEHFAEAFGLTLDGLQKG